MLYRWVYKNFLVHTDPEEAHHFAMKAIGIFGRSPLAPLYQATVGYRGGGSFRGLLARPLPGRLGMAAGQDKDAKAILGTIALGFAFTEIGTVTPKPQPGNEKPRSWRITEQKALRNKMGFNNDGADAVAERLAELRSTKRGRAAVVGVNIGKNKWTSAQDAPQDYSICAAKLARWADYLVINVSSPNTPGLRDLQAVDSLREIARATRQASEKAAGRRVPVLVKIAPDLDEAALDDIAADVATRHQLAYLDRPDERAHRELEVGGEYQWRREGEYHLFNPDTVFKLQHSTRTGQYSVFKEYTALVDDQSERMASLRGLLKFKDPKDAGRQPISIDEVEPASEIVKRFSTGAMSFGSISREADTTLAIAMNRIGGKSNTGEGGEDTEPVWTTRLAGPGGAAQIAVTGAGSSDDFRTLAIATQTQPPLVPGR